MGCKFVIVSGSRWVLSLWLFYMQASVSWTGCELQLVASARDTREVYMSSFGLSWPIPVSAFWIICRGLIVFDGSPARIAFAADLPINTRDWTRTSAACYVRKGLIFWCCEVQTSKIKQSLQCALWRSADQIIIITSECNPKYKPQRKCRLKIGRKRSISFLLVTNRLLPT